MSSKIDNILGCLHGLYDKLVKMKPLKRDALPMSCRFPGVYLFSKKGRALYVGRGKNVRERVLQHARPSITDTPFSFRMARKRTRRTKVSYRQGDENSRKQLLKDPKFRAALIWAKERISCMDIRFVRVDKAVTQVMLEALTAAVLRTPYNEFKTT